MPGFSGATPIVWGDHVFVSSPDADKNLTLICLSRKDGKVLWQKTVAVGDRVKGRNNMASPSPVTDGKSVFVIFGTGDLAAYDFDGNELWTRNLGKEYGHFANMWLFGSSPLLFEGRLYVQVLGAQSRRRPITPGPMTARRSANHICFALIRRRAKIFGVMCVQPTRKMNRRNRTSPRPSRITRAKVRRKSS